MRRIKYLCIGAILVFVLVYILGFIFPPSISEDKINEALKFCKKNNLSTEYAVFVDFGKHSGRERYMIYSFSQHRVIYRCLCATGLNKNKFSNTPGSNLSSLGKYRVNAKSRMILIHHSEVLNSFPKSIFPIPIIGEGISHGCFSITSEGLNKTIELRKPILLWAYK